MAKNHALHTIIEEIRAIKSTDKQLREFGVVMGIFFGIIAGVGLFKGKMPVAMISVSAAFFALGLIAPKLLLPLQKVWMGVAVVMGFVMSHVILAFLYFVILTPLSLIARATGKKFLEYGTKPDSYWQDHPKITDLSSYERQY